MYDEIFLDVNSHHQNFAMSKPTLFVIEKGKEAAYVISKWKKKQNNNHDFMHNNMCVGEFLFRQSEHKKQMSQYSICDSFVKTKS